MSKVPLVSVVQFRSITDALENLGFSSERIVARAGLPQWEFLDDSPLVPASHFYRLLKRATRIVGDEGFAFAAADTVPVQTVTTFSQALVQEPTVNAAVRAVARLFNGFTSSSCHWVAEGVDEIWWCRTHTMGNFPGLRQTETYVLKHVINVVSQVLGHRWSPPKVRLEGQAPPGLEQLEPLANTDIQVGQGMTAVAIPRALLPRRPAMNRARADVGGHHESIPANLVGSLEEISRSLLSFGHPQIAVVAESAGLSVRSLQRRLRERGVTFKKLVDQARFQSAVDLMREPDVKLVDVALDLGYADQAHFNRAFHRWAGVSPGEYRFQQLSH